jgi:dsRNA-specific ribonuclease
VEALVGALYLDGGLPAARRLLEMLGFFEKKYEE